jgi:recombination protein RecR
LGLPDSFERLAALWGRFPGVGAKTARRMIFYMLGQDREWAMELAHAIEVLREAVHPCPECGGITTEELCGVCSDGTRDSGKICVVETQEDCAAMEQSGVFGGLYHILGGKCSPLDGMDLPLENLDRLKSRIERLGAGEVILALPPGVEGDMTSYAVQDALSSLQGSVKISRLSCGLPIGASIGYADRLTLRAALESRREMEAE